MGVAGRVLDVERQLDVESLQCCHNFTSTSVDLMNVLVRSENHAVGKNTQARSFTRSSLLLPCGPRSSSSRVNHHSKNVASAG